MNLCKSSSDALIAGPAFAAGGTGMTSGKGTPDAARDVGDIFDESVTGPAQGPTDEKRVRMLYTFNLLTIWR